MKIIKELLNVTSVILIVLGVVMQVVGINTIHGRDALFSMLFWMAIVLPVYFIVSGLLVGKRSENVLFVPVLSLFISAPFWIGSGEIVITFLFVYLPFGYIGYYIGTKWRKKDKECK